VGIETPSLRLQYRIYQYDTMPYYTVKTERLKSIICSVLSSHENTLIAY